MDSKSDVTMMKKILKNGIVRRFWDLAWIW
jgi:hypothetical protein